MPHVPNSDRNPTGSFFLFFCFGCCGSSTMCQKIGDGQTTEDLVFLCNVGKTRPFLPPMTGNGKFIPPMKMVMTGGSFMTLFYPRYL